MRAYFLAATAVIALSVGFSSTGFAGVETMDQSRAKPQSAVMPISTATFIKEAAANDMLEVASGRMAEAKASRDEVRSFGTILVKAHTDSSAQLKSLVSAKDKNLLAAPLSLEQEKMLSDLKGETGGNFDTLYIAQQTDAHVKAIELYSAYAEHGEDAKLKAYAAQTLPRLQDHLQMARNLTGLQMAELH
jgi:putative membrane protein